jgi:aspartate/methionine/tyrosine aminotransferase
MTGYRSGIVAGDPELIAFFARFRSGMGVALPAPAEAASIAAWSDEAHVVERRAVFAKKRELFLAFFRRHGLEVFPNSSTFYLWVRAPEGSDGASYATRLLEHGIIVSPGTYFGAGNEGWIRVALVPDVQSCGEAIETWSKV